VIGWLTYEMTQSAFLTSLAMGLDALPLLIAGPIGGMLVDSRDRSKLLAYIYLYQASVTFIFGIVVILGLLQTWHIFAFIITMGFAWVILDPARITLISNTVPKGTLVNAFALNSLAFSIMRLAAPAAGGLMIVAIGPGPTLLAEAILQLIAFRIALGLDLPKTELIKLRLSSAVASTMEAVRYVKGQPVIFGLMLFGILPPMVVFPFAHGLLPVYAAEVYHVGPTGLGVLMASLGAGATIGMVVLASMGEIRKKGLLSIASLVLTALAMVALSQTSNPVIAFPVFMVLSIGVMAFMSTTSATIQSIVPDEFRGRVSALYVLSFGLMPVGSLVAGVLAQNLGARSATLIASGVVAVLITLLAIKFRSAWRPE
ncbi:MAG: MFS transporter, partial [Lysobacterales bacterium]